MKRKAAIPALTAIATALLSVGLLHAQVSTASIQGTVRDSTGAVIPGADLILHNVETGVDLKSATNAAGTFAIVNIPPGRYTLRVTKEGFQAAQQSDFLLSVSQSATMDFTLQVGSAGQTVTVSAEAPAIESSTAGLGTVMGSRQVNDLPLNGRNFTQLLALTPGASPINTAQTFAFRGVGAYQFPSFHGARNRANLFLLDGVINQLSLTSNYAVPPIVDDILEFKVDAHNDEVRYGGVSGGVVNVVTRSGTNSLHGALWEYVRNSAFDARNPFFTTVNALRQNQFGFNAGGPVRLPHYNGRNRTFFFGSYEGFRRSAPGQILGRIPTPDELRGRLGTVANAIYDPFSTTLDPANPNQYLRTPFPGNVIPESRLDPAMAQLAQALYPAPAVTTTAGTNYSATSPAATDQNLFNLRGDRQFGPNDSVWFRFTRAVLPTMTTSPIGKTTVTDTYHTKNYGANWTHVFGPGTVLQTQFGRTTAAVDTISTVVRAPSGVVAALSPDFACHFPLERECLLPSVSLVSYLGTPGDTHSLQGDSDIWSGSVNLSRLWRNHLINAGFSINTNNHDQAILYNIISYSPFQTADLRNPGRTGSDLASFLLGVPDGGQRRLQIGGTNGGWVSGFYVGDRWKASDRITVNYGVRIDRTLPPQWGVARDNTIYVGSLSLGMAEATYWLRAQPPFCPQTGKAPCIPGAALPDHVVVSPNGRIHQNRDFNIGPRLGIAYRLTSRTAIRTSGGIFYDNWAVWAQASQSYGGNWPQVTLLQAANQNPNVVTVRAGNPLSAIGAGALPAATPFNLVQFYKDPFLKVPYTPEWNFGIQHQIDANTGLSIDYVGSHGSRLDLNVFANTAPPGPGPQVDRRPIRYLTPTNYERSNGRSVYHALEASLNRRAAHDLGFLISYTWGKSIDISCSGWAGVEGCANQDPYNVNADRSVSAYDLTHVFNASVVWGLPFGRSRLFATGNRAIDYLIGGWQLNSITVLRSGIPYTIGVSGDIANTGNSNNAGFYERLNLVGNPRLSSPTPNQWFDSKAFAVPAPYTYGNMGRNVMRSDWGKNVDLSLFRKFALRERAELEFRAESFNMTNTPVWGTPVNNYSNLNFGRVLNIANTPRQLQFGLKLSF
jgi:hypothetical protein